MTKPKFKVLNDGRYKRVKSRWRKPRGTHNKKRMKMAWTGASPGIGYGNPAGKKGLLPDGSKEVHVYNVKDLEGLSKVSVRIGSAVGAKKRKLIVEKARSMKLRVLNPREKKKAFEPKKKASAKKGERK